MWIRADEGVFSQSMDGLEPTLERVQPLCVPGRARSAGVLLSVLLS